MMDEHLPELKILEEIALGDLLRSRSKIITHRDALRFILIAPALPIF
jgi:hypothetical protein